jgi:hypothetical protein
MGRDLAILDFHEITGGGEDGLITIDFDDCID